MTNQETTLRVQIAQEIATKFGSLAPYHAVQNFVRTGPAPKTPQKGGDA